MIGNTFQFEWEVKLIEWCQSYIPNSIINILDLVSYLGDTIFVVAIICFLYLCWDKKAGIKATFTAITSLMFAGEIKNILKRRRPYFDNKNIKCLKIVDKNYDLYDVRGQGYSFPSMHSSNICAVFGTIYNHYKKQPLLIFTIVISLIVGVSRFVLGCHYPTDVLAGWLLGAGAVIIFGKLLDTLDSKYIYIIMLSLGFVGMFFCESTDFLSAYGIAIGIVFANYIDEKYIKFNNTRNIIKMIFRLVIALGVFVGISEGLKLPFSSESLEANTQFAHWYRVFRYALACFAGIGLTPMLYKYNLLKLDDKMKDGK